MLKNQCLAFLIKKSISWVLRRVLHNSLWKLTTLQLYLRLELNLKKIHRALEINQFQWLEQYAEFYTQKRTEPEKNWDKDGKALYKLINNAVYGKSVENLRNGINVKLVSNKKDYLKWTFKPSCTSQKIFDNDLVAIRKNKITLTLNIHAYIGMYILELSKLLMCEFHYEYIKNKYGNNSKLLFTDTHSLMYEIKTEDIYEDCLKDKKSVWL